MWTAFLKVHAQQVDDAIEYTLMPTSWTMDTNAHLREWLHDAGTQFESDRDDLLDQMEVAKLAG